VDPRLLEHYNRELQFVREMGAEFAQEFPKIARRLGMSEDVGEVADPYVERLLEGFAFLTAKLQLQMRAEFPRFTQSLLEIVYPNFLAPMPSMLVAQMEPDLSEGALADGFVLPRGTNLRSVLGKGDRTACEYSTAQNLTMWPIEITEAQYFSSAAALAASGVVNMSKAKAGVRIRLRSTAGMAFDQTKLNDLRLFLRGGEQLPLQLYEELLGHCLGVRVRPKGGSKPWTRNLGPDSLKRVGFNDDEALLPGVHTGFKGYRLLREYFAFPQRFLFIDIADLGESVQACQGTELDIVVLLDRSVPDLQDLVTAESFALNCTPAINLVSRRATRVHLDDRVSEYHVVPDRTRPLDFEVYAVESMQGFGRSTEPECEFKAFYSVSDSMVKDSDQSYFLANRRPRMLSSKEKRTGSRSSYVGSEMFISVVDGREDPLRTSMRQLEISVLCTNRDLPLQLPLGRGQTDFTLDTGAPVEAVRCVAGPTKPVPSRAHDNTAWQLISQLSLNYLSVVDGDDAIDGAPLRQLLALYADTRDQALIKQIEGILKVKSSRITRRLPDDGPIVFARGLEIEVTCEASAYAGTGAFLLGAVLDEFFARYVSINSFTETVVRTDDMGEVMRWPARLGCRQLS
jgi:type VI secretion system protein ImpG